MATRPAKRCKAAIITRALPFPVNPPPPSFEPAMPLIRPSRDEDLAAITAIYAHHVLHGTGTFETDAAQRGRHDGPPRRRAVPRACPTWWPRTAARCSALPTATGSSRARPTAFRWKTRSTWHPSAHGKGLGRALLTELLARCERAGIRKVMAVIGDSANAGSVGVHRALGFTQVGVVAVLRLEVRPLARHRDHAEDAGRRRHARRPSHRSAA